MTKKKTPEIQRVFIDGLFTIRTKKPYVSIKGGNGRALFTSEAYETTETADAAIDLVFGPKFFANGKTKRIEVISEDLHIVYQKRVKW